MNILIKNVLLNNVMTDVLIENDTFKKIGSIDTKTIHIDKTIDATNKAILPAFYNLSRTTKIPFISFINSSFFFRFSLL